MRGATIKRRARRALDRKIAGQQAGRAARARPAPTAAPLRKCLRLDTRHPQSKPRYTIDLYARAKPKTSARGPRAWVALTPQMNKLQGMNEPTDPASPWIVETSLERFEADVLERSRQVPVVVDFWAAWCQPCRLLGPVLEKLAEDYQGRFVLVKADVDKLGPIAAQFAVQSIPAVYGVRHGQLVDYFVGVLSEPQIREWLDRFLPSEADLLVAAAEKIEATDPAEAEAKYRRAAEVAPDDAEAKIGLARVLLAEGLPGESEALIGQLEQRGFLEPEAEKVKAALELRQQGQEAGTVEQCRTALAADPDNLSLQLKLAEALAAQRQYNEALPLLLALVERDRHGTGEVARALMVDIFRLLPADSELVTDYRRRLSQALY